MINSFIAAEPHHSRKEIYYWKCDRPAAFHGTQSQRRTQAIEPQVGELLKTQFPGQEVRLRDGGGQGNHLTWIVEIGDRSYFLRVEDGPEQDNHLEVESHVMNCVRQFGVRTPIIHLVDARRHNVKFAWQLMELIPGHDLNTELKNGRVTATAMAKEIGAAIARWQDVPVTGFGHFDPLILRKTQQLQGFYQTYPEYFFLNWEQHLTFLEERQFLTSAEVEAIRSEVDRHSGLLELTRGCLVHKDLAFWNILGNQSGIAAFIDWDDSVSADEMDDFSLLGCFHDGPVLAEAMAGYQTMKALPPEFAGRFWIHLLRNMIVKSVIRVGAGYFDRTDSFFLFGAGMTGADLVQQTRSRIFRVMEGLRSMESPVDL